jgi:hypothetical protein
VARGARRRGCGALCVIHGRVPLAQHRSQCIVGIPWRGLHGSAGRSQEDQDGGEWD